MPLNRLQQGLQASPSYRSRGSSNRLRGLDAQDAFIARNFYHANMPTMSQAQQQQQQHGQSVMRSETVSSDGSSSDESVASSRNSHYVPSEDRRDDWQSTLDDSNSVRHLRRSLSGSISRLARKLKLSS